MNKTVEPKTLSGGLRVLPSKSASHRAVMMAAMAEGKTQLEPLQLSKDISATLACAQALGLTRGAAIAESETEGFVRAEIWGGGEGATVALGTGRCAAIPLNGFQSPKATATSVPRGTPVWSRQWSDGRRRRPSGTGGKHAAQRPP